MRVLKTLFLSFFWIGIVAGAGFLIGREIWLQIAISKLTTEAAKLGRIAENTGTYIQQCQTKGSNFAQGRIIDAIQLRFTSSTEYQIEVICTQYSIDPIVVERLELPMFITKAPGSSGLRWLTEPTAVSLKLWGRTRSLGLIEDKIEVGLSPKETSINYAPVTSCAGYGYTCCQAETALGEGDLISTATDCPRTCYTRCSPRPVILSVTTQPFLDQATRTLTVPRGSEVSVGFVVDHEMLEGVVTTIDFGDGQQQQFTEVSGFSSHTYQCVQQSCNYTIQVFSVADNGATSAETPISTVSVIVQ